MNESSPLNEHVHTPGEVPESVPQKRSKLNYLSIFCIALASAFLTATVVLIFQIKKGIPFSLALSLGIAIAAGFLAPMVIGHLVGKYRKRAGYTGYAGYYGFIITNLALSIGLGLIIF